MKDITGMRFGKLVAVEQIKTDYGYKWRCKCDCGGEKISTVRALFSGKSMSCGCLTSISELKMFEILTNNGYDFKKEYKFPDCKDKRCLPFDFAIFKNDKLLCLIELQGQQHYYPFTFNNESHETKVKNFEDRVKKDKIKEAYCKEHNIPLLTIKYTKFDKMEKILDDFINSLKFQ